MEYLTDATEIASATFTTRFVNGKQVIGHCIELLPFRDTPTIKFHNTEFTSYEKIKDHKALVSKLDLFDEIKEYKEKHFWHPAYKVVDYIDDFGVRGELRNKPVTHYKTKISNHQYFKMLGDILGVSVKAALKHYNALAYKVFVARYDNLHIKKFCLEWQKKCINTGRLNRLEEVAPILDQVKKDGIYHVAPWVFSTGLNPNKLKESFGKGAWKKLCKNSFHRNKLITTARTNYRMTFQEKIAVNAIPSTILQNHSTETFEVMQWLTVHRKGKWGRKQENRTLARIVFDTKQMAEELQQPFSLNWNEERMSAEHDRLVRLRNNIWRQRQVQKDADFAKDFPYVEELKEKELDTFVIDGYTATLICNGPNLQDEGGFMEHCVGLYSSSCRNGNYLVYSICDADGNRYSTLGINYSKHGDKSSWLQSEWSDDKYSFNQHYKKYNHKVDAQEAIDFASEIIKQLNSKGK